MPKCGLVQEMMLNGTTIFNQAAKCKELMELLRREDVLAQVEKLAKLKEAGVLSEEEFNAKKAVLLEKLYVTVCVRSLY